MAFNNSPSNNLTELGRAAKVFRDGAEQFCVFAFDLEDHLKIFPAPSARTKKSCMNIGQDPTNWLAAFWQMSQPQHTERRVLDKFHNWYSRYESSYGTPTSLYIYSFLIPCLRDGSNGHCSDAIAGMLEQYRELGKPMDVYIGWGNDDTDAEMAHATKNALADLNDDPGQHLDIFPKISIRK
jgi:hypothetical protein